jgi:hypothetical protein
MSSRKNILEFWGETSHDHDSNLSEVRLNANQTPVVPFTLDMVTVEVHYCEEPEVKGYVRCNEKDCVLCRAGKKLEERVLLPVYLPLTGTIGVLSISDSIRPGALKPPVMAALMSGRRLALLISKPDRFKHEVETRSLEAGHDDGAPQIAEFKRRWDADEVDLATVFQRLDNRDLAALPGIAKLLQYKDGAA